MRSPKFFEMSTVHVVQFFDKFGSTETVLAKKNPENRFLAMAGPMWFTDVRGFRLADFSEKNSKKTFLGPSLSKRPVFCARRKTFFVIETDRALRRRDVNFVGDAKKSRRKKKRVKSETVHGIFGVRAARSVALLCRQVASVE